MTIKNPENRENCEHSHKIENKIFHKSRRQWFGSEN